MPLALQCGGECLAVRPCRCARSPADIASATRRGASAVRHRTSPATGSSPDQQPSPRRNHSPFAGGEPRRTEVAAVLEIERTLQRRLKAEGTSFQRLLDDTRRELAQQYLGQTDVSLADATYLLGFSERGSFFRACRRWSGTSPRRYRIRLIGAR